MSEKCEANGGAVGATIEKKKVICFEICIPTLLNINSKQIY